MNPGLPANMNIQINKILDHENALGIARKNTHFFNSNGLKMMEEDFKTGFLFGAYDKQNMVGFICYKKLGFIPLETISPYKDWGKDNPCQIFVKIL